MSVENENVVEREVDVDAVEADLKASGAKVTPLAGGTTKNVGRYEFLTAAKVYKPKIAIVDLTGPFEGRQIKVRELTAGERDKYETKLVRGRLGNQKLNMEELRIGLVIAAAVDWDDEITPLFNDKDKDLLRNMGISVIQPIYDAASKLSAVTADDEKEMLGE